MGSVWQLNPVVFVLKNIMHERKQACFILC